MVRMMHMDSTSSQLFATPAMQSDAGTQEQKG